jgi:hypothetical protein
MANQNPGDSAETMHLESGLVSSHLVTLHSQMAHLISEYACLSNCKSSVCPLLCATTMRSSPSVPSCQDQIPGNILYLAHAANRLPWRHAAAMSELKRMSKILSKFKYT